MIGIGITTRNRTDVLMECLKHFNEYWPQEKVAIVCVDDGSTAWQAHQAAFNLLVGRKAARAAFRFSKQRLGIAKAKNACLALLDGCSDVFLFDDDCWPRRDGWCEDWLGIVKPHGVGHSQFNAKFSHMEPIGKIGSGMTEITAWNHCAGVMLHFSRACLDALGGYDPRAGLYGYEHAQMSQRAARAGFCAGHNYLSPSFAPDLIYSLDIHLGHWNVDPPLSRWTSRLISSCTQDEAGRAEENSWLLRDAPIHIPLGDPL